uniref:Uncharacterized protein n=1 Tax=Rhizophora mucronata TaxID=61149 RepID=A0A2P2LF53_RHIMU
MEFETSLFQLEMIFYKDQRLCNQSASQWEPTPKHYNDTRIKNKNSKR